MSARSKLRVGLAASVLLAGGLGAAALAETGCAPEQAEKPLLCPDPELFKEAVSPYLEKRCGTLDCHGSESRPLRIQGQLGLRSAVELNVSGGEPTTATELEANYVAVCGLEPENMADVVQSFGASADLLKLVAKPRGEMHHKGGKVVEQGDDGDRCITGWVGKLSNEDAARVRTECKAALDRLK